MRKIWDKLLFVLFTLIIIALCLGALGIAWKVIPFDVFPRRSTKTTEFHTNIRRQRTDSADADSLVVAVFSRPSEKSIVLRVTEYGIIRVSLETLDDLAQKHARSISYVREVKSRVVPVKDSVRIFLQLSLSA